MLCINVEFGWDCVQGIYCCCFEKTPVVVVIKKSRSKNKKGFVILHPYRWRAKGFYQCLCWQCFCWCFLCITLQSSSSSKIGSVCRVPLALWMRSFSLSLLLYPSSLFSLAFSLTPATSLLPTPQMLNSPKM